MNYRRENGAKNRKCKREEKTGNKNLIEHLVEYAVEYDDNAKILWQANHA